MSVRLVLLAAVLALTCSASAGAGARMRPLATGVIDPQELDYRTNPAAYAAARATGASFVRILASWRRVLPDNRPKGTFDLSDPEDPVYTWTVIDGAVEQAVEAGLTPIVDVLDAPDWADRARPGANHVPNDPSPTMFAQFMTAITARYSGRGDEPRVRYWMFWNEPNISNSLEPQFSHSVVVSPRIYRGLLIPFADAVHKASPRNVVIAGGLTPFTVDYPGAQSVGPLKFMRGLFCLTAGTHPRATCKESLPIDVWSVHPYTSGGPFHHAAHPNDASLGDLPKVKALLDAAVRAHTIRAPHGLGFWSTEFSWDTSPPDPKGLPVALQARWTDEALYQMWKSGITEVTWWLLKDQRYPASSYQSGLYLSGAGFPAARRKLTWTAFRFPFVAYLRGGAAYVWGRTPTSTAATVVLERKTSGGWSRLGSVRADAHGMFSATVGSGLTPKDVVRAIAGGAPSLAFSMTEPPDRLVRPFGR